MPEITSSGLSHTVADQVLEANEVLQFITPRETVASDTFIGYNYGMLEVDAKSEVLLRASIRDLDGTEMLGVDYTKS